MSKTKKDIVQVVYEKSDFQKGQVQEITDLVLDSIKEMLLEGHSVEIRGFGTFDVRVRDERMVRNPQDGTESFSPSHKTVHFLPGQDLNNF